MVRRSVAAVCLVVAVLAGCGSSSSTSVVDGSMSSTAEPTGPIERPVADEVADSIVRIVGFGCGAPALGSGFAVRPDLVVTSGHLVTGRDPETLGIVMLDGTEIGATLVGFDPDLDLAVLRIDEAVLEPVNIVTEVPVVSGVAIGIRSEGGAPLVNEVEFVVDAPVTVNWDGVFRDTESVFNGIRIDAEIRKGDSGSGLFVNDHDVIGLIHSKNRNGIPRGYAVGGADIAGFVGSIDPSVEVVADRCA